MTFRNVEDNVFYFILNNQYMLLNICLVGSYLSMCVEEEIALVNAIIPLSLGTHITTCMCQVSRLHC